MRLVREEFVLDMLYDRGYEGDEIPTALAAMGPPRLLHPPWKQDGTGYPVKSVAKHWDASVEDVKRWVRDMKEERDD
jgi:hypothetical protein